MKRIWLVAAALIAALLFYPAPMQAALDEPAKEGAPEQPVVILKIDGPIIPMTAQYIRRGIGECESRGALCIIEMNTPGGLMNAMEEIISRILESRVPVVTYVYPDGAYSGSAGVYIQYASHVAAMAPATNMGSAHPVFGGAPSPGRGGGCSPEDEDDKKKEREENKTQEYMYEKVTNHAVAYIKSLAEKRGRNKKWAEEVVRKSVNVTASEALKMNIIDLIAGSEQELLKVLRGRKAKMAAGEITLNPSSNPTRVDMTWAESFIFRITNPQIAMILMTLGFLGLVYEFTSPGAVLPGVGGGICLILGLYAMGTLPINYAGLALIVFAFLLFFLEIYATTHGFLAIGGVISFILGSLMLIPAGYEYFRIPLTFIITVAVTIGGASILLARMVWKNLHKKAVSGKEELIGAKGVVKTPLEPFGHIFILGELWRGKAVSGTIAKDTEVRVIDKEGLTLIVEPLEGVREKPSEKG